MVTAPLTRFSGQCPNPCAPATCDPEIKVRHTPIELRDGEPFPDFSLLRHPLSVLMRLLAGFYVGSFSTTPPVVRLDVLPPHAKTRDYVERISRRLNL